MEGEKEVPPLDFARLKGGREPFDASRLRLPRLEEEVDEEALTGGGSMGVAVPESEGTGKSCSPAAMVFKDRVFKVAARRQLLRGLTWLSPPSYRRSRETKSHPLAGQTRGNSRLLPGDSRDRWGVYRRITMQQI